MSHPRIEIDQVHLELALLVWEKTSREPGARTREDMLALPPEQVARESAEYLWSLLNDVGPG